MKKLATGLLIMSSISTFAGQNCEYNSNDNDQMPKTKMALTQKGYTLTDSPEATFELVASVNLISFNNVDHPVINTYDVEGAAIFKDKKKNVNPHARSLFPIDNSYVSTTLWKYKITLPSSLETSSQNSYAKAIEILDKRIANKISKRLIGCN